MGRPAHVVGHRGLVGHHGPRVHGPGAGDEVALVGVLAGEAPGDEVAAVVEHLAVHPRVARLAPARGAHLGDGPALAGGHGLLAHVGVGGAAAALAVQRRVVLEGVRAAVVGTEVRLAVAHRDHEVALEDRHALDPAVRREAHGLRLRAEQRAGPPGEAGAGREQDRGEGDEADGPDEPQPPVARRAAAAHSPSPPSPSPAPRASAGAAGAPSVRVTERRVRSMALVRVVMILSTASPARSMRRLAWRRASW